MNVLIPLEYVVAVGTPVVSALVAAIVWLAKAKDRAEQGRLDDLKASSQLVRETHERVLPVIERISVEMRLRNERAARRHVTREGDSDPPERLEDTATRLRRIAVEIEGRDSHPKVTP